MQYFNKNKIISQARQALATNGGTLASYLCSPHFLSIDFQKRAPSAMSNTIKALTSVCSIFLNLTLLQVLNTICHIFRNPPIF